MMFILTVILVISALGFMSELGFKTVFALLFYVIAGTAPLLGIAFLLGWRLSLA